MEIVPLAARTNPITALNSVDLPEPFTPTRAAIDPPGTLNDASRSAVWPLR